MALEEGHCAPESMAFQILAASRVIITSDQNGPLCDLSLLALLLAMQKASEEFQEDAGDTLVES